MSLPLCSLALALLMDISLSVDSSEFTLQAESTARALTSPKIVELIEDHANMGGLALSVIFWASDQEIVIPWSILQTESDVKGLAEKLKKIQRPNVGPYTGVFDALHFAMDSLETLPCQPTRIIFDISGDGVNNHGSSESKEMKLRAEELGVRINGLPIGSSTISSFYEREVATGFIIPISGFEEFAEAISKKLQREIVEVLPFGYISRMTQ